MKLSNNKVGTDEKEDILLAQKDKRHFGKLYERYYEQVFRYIDRRVSNIQLAEEVCSNVFFKALNKIDTYEYRGYAFSSWLYRIAYNEINLYYRSNNTKRMVYVESAEELNLKESFQSTDDHENNQVLLDEMIKQLDGLNEKDLALMEMFFFEGMSHREISEILNISEGNAKVKVHRIKDRIRKKIENNSS